MSEGKTYTVKRGKYENFKDFCKCLHNSHFREKRTLSKTGVINFRHGRFSPDEKGLAEISRRVGLPYTSEIIFSLHDPRCLWIEVPGVKEPIKAICVGGRAVGYVGRNDHVYVD